MILLYNRRQGSGDTDTVAAHDQRMGFLILVCEYCPHGFRVLGAQLENLAHFNTLRSRERLPAYRAAVSRLRRLDIRDDISFVISAIVDIDVVAVLLAGTGAHVLHAYQFGVHDDLAVMQMHRSREAAHSAGDRSHLRFICEFQTELRNIQCIHDLDHVDFSVASDERRHITVHFQCLLIQRLEEERFDRLFFV